jgi:hypothetical protein
MLRNTILFDANDKIEERYSQMKKWFEEGI